MKRLTGVIFIFISCTIVGKSSESILDYFNIFRDKEHIELLSTKQKDQLLFVRRQYFKELQILQEELKNLRKKANECMIQNNEQKYEEIHDKMNKLKLEKKLLKESYEKKIDKILKKS